MLRGPTPAVLSGSLQPPPEPFLHFVADYRSAQALDLAGQMLNPLTHHAERFVFVAKLPSRPAAELIWQEGQAPGRALAQRDRSHLWVLRQLDVVNAEYAVRGANTGAIEHVFLDLQTRFRPFLMRISVQADTDPECTVVLRLARFNLQELPALVTSLRGLGRAGAAQLKACPYGLLLWEIHDDAQIRRLQGRQPLLQQQLKRVLVEGLLLNDT